MKSICWENFFDQKKFTQACFPAREKYMGLHADSLVKDLFHDVNVLSFECAEEIIVYSRLIGISVSDSRNIEFYGLYIGGVEGDEQFVVRRGLWAKRREPVTYDELVSRLMCTSVVIKAGAGKATVDYMDSFFPNRIPPFEATSGSSCNTVEDKRNTRLDLDMNHARFNLEYSDVTGRIAGVDDIFLKLKNRFNEGVSAEQIGEIYNPRISYERDDLYSFLQVD